MVPPVDNLSAFVRLPGRESSGGTMFESSRRNRRVRIGRSLGALTTGALLVVLALPAPAAFASPTESCRSIPVDADPALRSDLARLDYGVDGSGVTVGVISDSYAAPLPGLPTPADDVAAGLLPGPGNPCGRTAPVSVLADRTDGTHNEGRAMLQLVHGIAPGARLMFTSVDDEDPESIAAGIDALSAAGADVIVDDVGTGKEPFFQQSVAGQAIERATASGKVYLSSAGNGAGAAFRPREGQTTTEISGWDTVAFRPTTCPEVVVDAVIAYGSAGSFDCMDFSHSPAPDATLGYTIVTNGGELLYLQWGEPAGDPEADFVPVALLNGVALPQSPKRLPSGVPGYEITLPLRQITAQLEIAMVRVSNPADPSTLITPRLALRMPGYMLASAEYPTSQGDDTVGRSIYGHNGDPATISVAAAPADDPLVPEQFSSAGPSVYLFTPQGPAARALPAPQINRVPDVMSVDRVRNSVLGTPADDPGMFVFSGTSAAAPNAAAVMALALQADPSIDQRRARELLRSTARAVTASHPGIAAENVVGAGLIDARAVLAEVVENRPAPSDAPERPAALAATGAEFRWQSLLALAALLAGATLLCTGGTRRSRASA